jgi:hypothetical protein
MEFACIEGNSDLEHYQAATGGKGK